MLFGDNWLLAAFFVQALLFACIFPVLCQIARLLFNSTTKIITLSFLFLTLSGTYLVTVPVILTDLFFTVFLTLGLYLSLLVVIRNSWVCLAGQVVVLGYAAQIRPVLGLYAIVNFVLMVHIAYKIHVLHRRKTGNLILVSSICLLVSGNLPALRNYVNHGFLKPTDVLATNMFDYLARSVLDRTNNSAEYYALAESVKKMGDIKDATEIKERYAIDVFKRHPLATLTQVGRNAIGIMLRGHWAVAAQFWGLNFKDLTMEEFMPLKKSLRVFVVEVLFNSIYALLYVFFWCYLIRLYRLNEISLLLTTLVFVSYFLIPTFMVSGAGSRLRLPVEGIIVLTGLMGFESHQKWLSDKVITRLYATSELTSAWLRSGPGRVIT